MTDTMTLEQLLNDYDWECVFADDGNGSEGNCTKDVEAATPDTPIDPPPTRRDVDKIIAVRQGVHDEDDWLGVFLLNDGRFLFARGGCDYTGWD